MNDAVSGLANVRDKSDFVLWALGVVCLVVGYLWKELRTNNKELRVQLETDLQECKEGHKRAEERNVKQEMRFAQQEREIGELKGRMEEAARAYEENRAWHKEFLEHVANNNSDGHAKNS